MTTAICNINEYTISRHHRRHIWNSTRAALEFKGVSGAAAISQQKWSKPQPNLQVRLSRTNMSDIP